MNENQQEKPERNAVELSAVEPSAATAESSAEEVTTAVPTTDKWELIAPSVQIIVEKDRKLQEADLAIKDKFGKNAILKGVNFKAEATTRDRTMQIGGHKSGQKR